MTVYNEQYHVIECCRTCVGWKAVQYDSFLGHCKGDEWMKSWSSPFAKKYPGGWLTIADYDCPSWVYTHAVVIPVDNWLFEEDKCST